MQGKAFFSSAALLVSSILLFSLSQPGILCANGIALCGWFVYVPLFLLIRRHSYKLCALLGALYGVCGYGLFGFWLFRYNFMSFVAVCVVCAVLFAVLCVLLRGVHMLFPQIGWLFQALLVLLCEYARTLGDFGFHYGVLGYSQWRFGVILRCAAVVGVWGITALMLAFSALCAHCVATRSVKRNAPAIVCVAVCILCFICYGAFCRARVNDESAAVTEKTLSVALIQNNSDPWQNGLSAYQNEVSSLVALTEQALEAHPDVQLVVWPETAVVPDIVYHYYNVQSDRHALVTALLEYIESKDCAFVIGNNHTEFFENASKSYNSALYFEPHKNVIPPRPLVYNKMRLVPLTEYLPKSTVFLSPLLQSLTPHYWNAGERISLFTCAEIPFATPICFEDTFPSSVRAMKESGALLVVNLTNDSWAHSIACQKQHLAMAVFRSAENRIPTVRSTVSGQTAVIDQYGTVVAEAAAFTPCYLYAEIAVPTGNKKQNRVE